MEKRLAVKARATFSSNQKAKPNQPYLARTRFPARRVRLVIVAPAEFQLVHLITSVLSD